jgi:hypothetical protein
VCHRLYDGHNVGASSLPSGYRAGGFEVMGYPWPLARYYRCSNYCPLVDAEVTGMTAVDTTPNFTHSVPFTGKSPKQVHHFPGAMILHKNGFTGRVLCSFSYNTPDNIVHYVVGLGQLSAEKEEMQIWTLENLAD